MEYQGSCHCKTVKFTLKTNLEKIIQCNCSFCKRRNAKMVLEPKANILFSEGSDNLNIYEFGTKVAKHHFCKTCGIFVYSIRRFDPNGIAANLGCIDNIDIFNIETQIADNKNK